MNEPDPNQMLQGKQQEEEALQSQGLTAKHEGIIPVSNGDDAQEGLINIPDPAAPLIKSVANRNPFVVNREPLAHRRERARDRIAIFLILLFAGVIILSFLTVWFADSSSSQLDDILPILVSPISGLLGAVVGFYYGQGSNLTPDDK